MIYTIPTKRGLGVEIWGTYFDLLDFYRVLSKFWNNAEMPISSGKGFQKRDELLSGFSYEIRKAMDGSRLKRKSSHFYPTEIEHFGTQVSWVHFLFSMAGLKYNMGYYETNKFDIAMVLQIEYWLKKSMYSYDAIGASSLVGYIDNGLYGANENIYQFMLAVNAHYFSLGGGKRSFRKLPNLLKRGVFFSDEYKNFENYLKSEAKRLNCDIHELEIDDSHIDWDKIKW